MTRFWGWVLVVFVSPAYVLDIFTIGMQRVDATPLSEIVILVSKGLGLALGLYWATRPEKRS